MKKKLLKRAKKLAARPYQVHIIPDFDTDGNQVLFARIPEMPGCVAHGDSIEEVKEWLELAKIDFIYFYLEDGLMPPEPEGFECEESPQMQIWRMCINIAAKRRISRVGNNQFQQ